MSDNYRELDGIEVDGTPVKFNAANVLTNVGGVFVVDDTLSISGAAADAKKTGDVIGALREDLNLISETPNLFNAGTATDGYRLNSSDGADYADNNYFVSAYIPVTVGHTYTKNSPTADAYHRYCTYDSSKGFVRAISDSNDVVIASGEAYVRFCGQLTEKSSTTLYEAGSTTAVDKVARADSAEIARLGSIANSMTKEVQWEGWEKIYTATQASASEGLNTINGYIRPASGSYPGRISSSSSKRTRWFQADHEMQIYIDGGNPGSSAYGDANTLRLRISTEQPETGNSKAFTGDLYESSGKTAGTLPTAENPLTVPQGKYVAFGTTSEFDTYIIDLYEYVETTKVILADDIGLSATQKSYVDGAVADVSAEIDGVEFKADTAFKKTNDLTLTWSNGYFTSAVGNDIGASLSSNSNYKSAPVFNLPYPVLIGNDRIYQIRICLADASTMLITERGSFGAGTIRCIPAGVPFRFTIQRTDGEAITSDTDADINAHVFVSVLIQNGILPVKWLALGDSITEGWRSGVVDGSVWNNSDASTTWVCRVARANGWEVDNKGVGSSGWLDPAPDKAWSPAWVRARNLDFTPYNLVTLAYGINDWKANKAIGTIADDGSAETCTTVMQAMKATIEGIMASNPACKIIVITPMNCWGYSYAYGNKAGNYGLGYSFSNSGTLEQFVTKMIEVCDYYGIQYIDMTHCSPINRENLPIMLPDGVHPSVDCHKLIAHELSKKITF